MASPCIPSVIPRGLPGTRAHDSAYTSPMALLATLGPRLLMASRGQGRGGVWGPDCEGEGVEELTVVPTVRNLRCRSECRGWRPAQSSASGSLQLPGGGVGAGLSGVLGRLAEGVAAQRWGWE